MQDSSKASKASKANYAVPKASNGAMRATSYIYTYMYTYIYAYVYMYIYIAALGPRRLIA